MRRRGIIGSGGKKGKPDYFYVENISGTNTIMFRTPNEYSDYTAKQPILVYSLDEGETWSDWGSVKSKSESGQRKITLSNGSRLLIRAKTTTNGFATVSSGQAVGLRLTFRNGTCKIGGNIMFLLDSTGEQTTVPSACFGYFFWRNSSMSDGNALVDASDLRLPATTVGTYAYYRMFYNQNKLVYAPQEISALTMTGYVCDSMFYSNSELKTAPYIKATSISGASNLNNMFYSDYYVQEVHMDIASASGSNNFSDWLYSISDRTGKLYCPSSLTLPTNSSSGVPKKWTRYNNA